MPNFNLTQPAIYQCIQIHIHLVVPGGGVDKRKKQWKKVKGKYLFNEFFLAKVFRAQFLEALVQQGFSIPLKTPKAWMVNCIHVGKGCLLLNISHVIYTEGLPVKKTLLPITRKSSRLNILKEKRGKLSTAP